MTTPIRILTSALVCMLPGLSAKAEVNKEEKVAPGVFFHEGEIATKGHCNNGWIVMEDYVLVVDANFPLGAEEVLPKIKATSEKPIRFAFDTHHHGDHAYGNQFWAEQGAVPVAHTGVREEMRRLEPQRWNETAKGRKDVAASKLKEPSLLFPKELYFDDGKVRVELHHFGVAHTRGDGFAWLPNEKILFTGDACVNGPYNFVGDGNIEQWIKTLEEAKKLQPKIVCPGHGPMGDASLLENQQKFFIQLRAEAQKFLTSKASKRQIQEGIPRLREEMKKDAGIGRYVGDGFAAQLEKAYTEMGGKPFMSGEARQKEERKHQHAHGHEHEHGSKPGA
jgi:cyclase